MTETKRFKLPDRIDALQALRFLGAMCVTIYHFTGLQGDCPFNFSNAVYLFYMISGFVVMLSTEDPAKKRFFLTRRLIRTLPLYWGLTLFTFAAGQFFPAVIGYRPTVVQLVKSMLFIPFSRTTARAGAAIRPLVGLGHTLQMEMLFYVLFLLAMRLSHKRRGFIAAGLSAAVALTGVFFPTKNPVVHFYTANPYVWTSFIAGLAVYGAFRLIGKKEPPLRAGNLPALLAVAAAVSAAVPVFLCKTSVWYDIGMLAVVLCAGLVWSACGKKTPRALIKPGDISFSYYLLHYYTVTLGARALGIGSFRPRDLLLAALISAGTWGISWVSWYVIENKLTRFLLSRLPKTA